MIESMTGIINIYKEKGYTSHDVVAIVRKLLSNYKKDIEESQEKDNTDKKGKKRKIKTGHTGTLDPQAEGVLPICVGRATKLADYLTVGIGHSTSDKSYRAELILGMTTDTDDHTGKILTTGSTDGIKISAIEEVITSFIGGYMQTPPMYSAIKIEGKKLYDLARAGKTVERKSRHVDIPRIAITDINLENNRLWIEVDCSKGTYIRSLCADIGQKLGCGGCMGDLIRTKSGTFHLKDSIYLSELKPAIEENRRDFLMPVDKALPVPKGIITNFIKQAINGLPVPYEQVSLSEPLSEGQLCWLYGKEDLIGLYTLKKGMFKPEVMMYDNH
ncbi:MAG: tRNA pseudouridine(55) synthase TruB [Defluviitaleaceae bacterium]|nr:tRNA pseudouridine(55) synthase TruB [Defluviitaleaceae bacterium]